MSAVTKSAEGVSPSKVEQGKLRKLIIATSVGNALEFYDIIVYGYFAIYLSNAFFPNQDPRTAVLVTFGTFGISFLIRPIGGLVLGAYADRHGRKASLMVSIVMMTFSTLTIALMPSYATIGVAAPIAVLLARLLQGFSAGGEFGSSTAFLVEHAPSHRGFIASWQFASQGFSTLLASCIGMVLASVMSPEMLQAWGWRIPFFVGVLIGPVRIYIRNHIEDALPPPAAEKKTSPIGDVFTTQKAAVLLAIGALAVSTAINYLLVYLPTFVVKTLKLPPSVGFTAAFVGGIVLTILTPIAGGLSDRIGRTRHMLIVAGLMLVSIYPCFLVLTGHPTSPVIVLAVFWLAMLKGAYYGPLAALMADLFPAANRATGLGLSYNIGVTAFGGLGPVIMTWLEPHLGALAPGYYLSAVCLLSILSLGLIRGRTRL